VGNRSCERFSANAAPGGAEVAKNKFERSTHTISATIAPETPAPVPELNEEEDQLALEQRLYEESLKVLDEGQVLTGVIVAKYQDELLVDIGGKSEGILPFRELSLAIEPKELVVGDKLEVMIHRIDENDGQLYLSERRARALKTWEKVIEAHDNDEVIEATVTQVVKGGVLVDLGMRGFVPASCSRSAKFWKKNSTRRSKSCSARCRSARFAKASSSGWRSSARSSTSAASTASSTTPSSRTHGSSIRRKSSRSATRSRSK
jgi:hypothetical protein